MDVDGEEHDDVLLDDDALVPRIARDRELRGEGESGAHEQM